MVRIGFIGAGIVGTALAFRLSQKGYLVAAVSDLSSDSAKRLASLVTNCQVYETGQEVADNTNFVFITTPDDVIPKIAAEINWHNGQSVVHCSGANSLNILEPAKQAGAFVGSFHPLQTFASINQAIDNLPGSTFALEADEPLLSQLKEMAEALDGSWIVLNAQDKILYHTAAVFACNYVVTLVKLATDLWQVFGIPPNKATQALLPLLRGTVNNIGNIGLPNCLTGPIARGDLGTIKKHLKALETNAPALVSLYADLGLHTIPIALAKGRINREKAEELEALFKEKGIKSREQGKSSQ